MLQHAYMGDILKTRLKQTKQVSTNESYLLNILVAAGYVKKEYEDFCKRYELTFTHHNILRILRDVHPDGHSRQAIKERMIDPSPDVTRVLDAMIKRELVERFTPNTDRRVSSAKITDKGLEILKRIDAPMRQFEANQNNRLTESEKTMLSMLLEKTYKEKI